jgi:GMP synthase-like glutamine amidotransferase
VIESVSFKGPSATIKTHHNRAGLPHTRQWVTSSPVFAVQFHPEADGLVTVWMSHGDTVTDIQAGMIYGCGGRSARVP